MENIISLFKEAFIVIADEYKYYFVNADNILNASNRPRFPIDRPSQAKKALNRVSQLTQSPTWWEGSVNELKTLVENKIKEKYIVENKGGKFIVKQK